MNAVALSTWGYISISQFRLIQQIVDSVPLLPVEAQSLLTKTLELPLPPEMTTEALGIHQSDVILRSALIASIADIRANPFLLKYVFASLPRDPVTMNEYGEQEVQRAIEWFQRTDIRVIFNINPNEAKFPCISISLQSSIEQEQEGTLGDIHYTPTENNGTQTPIIVGPLTPTAYNSATGIMTLDSTALSGVVLAPNMMILDKIGKQYKIQEVLDDNVVVIDPGTVADFGAMVIRPATPAFVTTLESTVYRESYGIGCHVMSEAVHLTYLHSIIVFCLLRYKQALLEARGFERSTLSSSDLKRDEESLPEFVYSRYITITGAVRQYWPKNFSRKIDSALVDFNADGTPINPRDPFEDIMDSDSLTVTFEDK